MTHGTGLADEGHRVPTHITSRKTSWASMFWAGSSASPSSFSSCSISSST